MALILLVMLISCPGQLFAQSRLRNNNKAGFRIHLHEDQSISSISKESRSIVRQAVNEAVEYWSSTLKARRTVKKILIDRQCGGPGIWTGAGCPVDQGCSNQTTCGEVTVPASHLASCLLCDGEGQCRRSQARSGPGVANTDLVLYISSKLSSLCRESQTLSHAGHCQQEPDLDRPVAGHVNICPNNLDNPKELTENIKHEILHVLGFSVKLYAFFRDRSGKPRTKRTKSGRPPLHKKYYLHVADNTTVARVVRNGWKLAGGVTINKPVHVLVTPRVRREVRNHFRCRDLEGGELEDQGDYGTALTHWEKRVFGDEAMTGNHQELEVGGQVYYERKLISRMTLAVLHDSGWYNVDFSKASPDYTWGKGLGCDFVKTSCYQYMKNKPKIQPYCQSKSKFPTPRKLVSGKCRPDKVEFCNLIKYSKPLPPEYRNVEAVEGGGDDDDGSHWGAGMWLSDFCPSVVTLESKC